MPRQTVTAALSALILAALLAAPGLGASKPATKPQKTDVDRPGLETIMQDDGQLVFRTPADAQAAVARMKALGVDRVRITASWSSLTRDPASTTKPANFDAADPAAYEQTRWAALDAAVRAVNDAGLKTLIDIGFWAPHWATADPPGPRARTNIDPQAYADFAVALALRYSGAFTSTPDPVAAAAPPPPNEDETLLQSLLQPPQPAPPPPPPPAARLGARAAQDPAAAGALPLVDEFVLWNEPNIPALLLPQWAPDGTTPASPAIYRAMVRAAYPAIKRVRKHVKVLIGNTSSTGGKRGSGAVAPLEFLRSFACVDGNFKPLQTPECANFKTIPGDGWAHHPYSQNERPSRVSDPVKEPGDLRMADLPVLATALDRLVKAGRLAPADRDIYLTEFGYETTPVQGRPDVSEIQQARWLTWAEYLADKVPQVKSFAQFLLRDQSPAPVRVSTSNARPFGEFTTGLLVSSGNDKMAAKTFVAGLFAQLQRKGRVLLYGRLRLGAGPKTILLQRQLRLGGRWRTFQRLAVDGRFAFQRVVPHIPGAVYRMTYPDAAGVRQRGLPVKPVPVGR